MNNDMNNNPNMGNNMNPGMNMNNNNQNPSQMNHYMNMQNNFNNNMNNPNPVQYNDQYVEYKEPKKKGNKKLLIVLIVIIVLGVIAALVVPSMLKKDEKKKEEPKEEVLTKDSTVVKELFETFREDGAPFIYYMIEDNNTNIYKISITARSLTWDKDFVKCGELFTGDNSYYCEDHDDEEINGKEMEVATIKEEDFNTQFKKIFGKNATYNANDIGLTEIMSDNLTSFAYVKDKKIFVALKNYGDGGTEKILNKQTIEDVKSENGKLSIITKVDWEDSSSGDEPTGTYTITYNFVKEQDTGNYVFESRELK